MTRCRSRSQSRTTVAFHRCEEQLYSCSLGKQVLAALLRRGWLQHGDSCAAVRQCSGTSTDPQLPAARAGPVVPKAAGTQLHMCSAGHSTAAPLSGQPWDVFTSTNTTWWARECCSVKSILSLSCNMLVYCNMFLVCFCLRCPGRLCQAPPGGQGGRHSLHPH